MELKIKINVPDLEDYEEKTEVLEDIKSYVTQWYPGAEVIEDND